MSFKNNLNNSSCFNNMNNKSPNEKNNVNQENNEIEESSNTNDIDEESTLENNGNIIDNQEQDISNEEEINNSEETQEHNPRILIHTNITQDHNRVINDLRSLHIPPINNPLNPMNIISALMNQNRNLNQQNQNNSTIEESNEGELNEGESNEGESNEGESNQREFNDFLNSNDFENHVLDLLNRTFTNNDQFNNNSNNEDEEDDEDEGEDEVEENNNVDQVRPVNFSSFIRNLMNRSINYYDQANQEFKEIIGDNKESQRLYNYCCYLLFRQDRDFCGRFTDEYLKRAHLYLQEHYSIILNQIEDTDFEFFQGIFHPIIDSLYDKFLQNKTNNCIEILNQYITDEKFDTNQNEECCICKIGDDEKTVKLKCGHKMHYDCVKTWFIENTVCPICREEHDPIKIEENKKKLEIEKERFELDLMQKEDKINYNEEDYEDMPPLIENTDQNPLVFHPPFFPPHSSPLHLTGFSTFIENDTITNINNLRRPNQNINIESNTLNNRLQQDLSSRSIEDSSLFGTTTASINFRRRLNPSNQVNLQSDNITTNSVTESNLDNTQDDNVMQDLDDEKVTDNDVGNYLKLARDETELIEEDSDDEIENNNINIAEEKEVIEKDHTAKRKFDSESSEDD